MKITTNNINQKFTGAFYIRGETIDKADALCRSIATRAKFDKMVMSSENGEDEFLSQIEEAAKDSEETDTEDLVTNISLYPYNDSAMFLKLRKVTGTEEQTTEPPHDDDIKKAFTLQEEHRKIDIRA